MAVLGKHSNEMVCSYTPNKKLPFDDTMKSDSDFSVHLTLLEHAGYSHGLSVRLSVCLSVRHVTVS